MVSQAQLAGTVWLQGSGQGSLLITAAPLLFIFLIFYFVLIMPQQKRQKRWQQMLSDLKAGDKVVTSGGLRGTIIAVKEDAVHLRVPPDNLRLELARNAVVSVDTGEGPAKKDKD